MFLFGLSVSALFAAEVKFAGTAQACFGFQCTPSAMESIVGLSYYGSTFEGTTSDGFLAFGGSSASNSQNAENFGLIEARVSNTSYSALPFTLLLDFALPSGIAGNPLAYSAKLTGNLRAGAGGVGLIFDNSGPYSYTFGQGGHFDLIINNLAIAPGQTASINGFIVNAISSEVPEPKTASLLIFGAVTLIASRAFSRRMSF